MGTLPATLKGVGIRVDLPDIPRDWASPFIPDLVRDQLAINPQLTEIFKARFQTDVLSGWKSRLGRAWTELAQVTTKRIGMNVGVDLSVYTPVLQNLTSLALPDGRLPRPEDFLADLVNMGVGIATDLMGAIPVVGQIASGLISLGQTIATLVRGPTPPPEVLIPLQNSSTETDQFLVEVMQDQLEEAVDWDLFFMPPFEAGSMRVETNREGGFQISGEGTSGFGVIPGGQIVFGSIQLIGARDFYRKPRGAIGRYQGAPYPPAGCSTLGPTGNGVLDSRLPRCNLTTQALVNRAYPFYDIVNTGDYYPGVRALGMNILSQIQKFQSQMWCVDANRVYTSWADFMREGCKYAEKVWNGSTGDSRVDGIKEEIRAAIAMGILKELTGMTRDPWDSCAAWVDDLPADPNTMLHARIRPFLDRLASRQRAGLDRLAMVTAPEKGGAFKSARLKDLLEERRRQFLTHQDRYQVDPNNIPDEAFKRAVIDSRGGMMIPQIPANVRAYAGRGPAFTGPRGPAPPLPPLRLSGPGPFASGTPRAGGWPLWAKASLAFAAGGATFYAMTRKR